MPLIKCAECGKEVSNAAGFCPSCGYPTSRARLETRGADAIVVAFAFFLSCFLVIPLYFKTQNFVISFLIAMIPTCLAFAYASRKKKKK